LPKEWVSYCVFAFTPLLNEVVVHQRIKDICELPLISSPSIADTAVFKSLHPLANPQGLDWGYVERLVYLILQEALKLINHYPTPLLNGGPHRIPPLNI